MIVRPVIGDWPVPNIERIESLEHRRLSRMAVPGLVGDLHQDLGAASVVVEIEGSVFGDEARDEVLTSLREPFLLGDVVTFVADITTATTIEEVVIEDLFVGERNDGGGCRYVVRLRQYVEPPEPPSPIDDLGAELDAELDALAGLGLDGLELPGLVGDIPDIADPTPPVREALGAVESAVAPLGDLLSDLRDRIS